MAKHSHIGRADIRDVEKVAPAIECAHAHHRLLPASRDQRNLAGKGRNDETLSLAGAGMVEGPQADGTQAPQRHLPHRQIRSRLRGRIRVGGTEGRILGQWTAILEGQAIHFSG
jgi:hypothetical protein